MTPYLELVCPAGSPAALRAAIEAGADTVYCSYNDRTNARNYPGLNFDVEEMAEGVAYAHRKGAKVLVAINTFPPAGQMKDWQAAVDNAAEAGAAGWKAERESLQAEIKTLKTRLAKLEVREKKKATEHDSVS